METAATAMTGTSVATIKNTDNLQRKPCRRRKPGRFVSAGGLKRSIVDNRYIPDRRSNRSADDRIVNA
jgi:hypothetical protein